MAYTNTYTAVTWTSGDTITETKMDNMVSNDQAYDSHTASGFQLDNNVGYSQENAAGTRKVILNVNASDELHVGVNGENDHTVVNAGTSKLVKIKVLRQDDTSDSYENNTVLLCGWGYVTGDGTNHEEVDAVSFGITFSGVPIVVSSMAGAYSSAGTPSVLSDFDATIASGDAGSVAGAYAITTSGCNIIVYRVSLTGDAASALSNDIEYGYCWNAIGQLN